MDKLPVGQLPDLASSNNDDEIMVITNSEYSQLKKEKISDLITDFTSTNENNALTKGTDGKMFVTDFGNASNITEGTLPVSVLPDIPKDLLPAIETSDLPVSGITANTYTYPSSVTVNAQGQVTAIEEGTPSGANANTDLSNITDAGKEVIKENSKSGTGLEIGDIGIAALGIDESKGLRRYLNGSILTANANTQGFINKLKSAAALYPSLICTETQWQGIASTSVGGQCGKFVLNYDTDETTVISVRLPKIITPIQGLTNLTNLGELVEAGLPNITGKFVGGYTADPNTAVGGAFKWVNNGGSVSSGAFNTVANYTFSAEESNPIYNNSDTVQPEAVQYPYFIQIATGQETEVNITNKIELNNPYTLFDSKYTDAPLYNISWLKSDGEYRPKTTYITAYEALVVENNSEVTAGTSVTLPSGTDYVKRGLSVKLSTASDITDYDFVINTTNETFRLPLKTKLAGGKAVVGNGMTLGLTDGTLNFGMIGHVNGTYLQYSTENYNTNVGSNIIISSSFSNKTLGITTDETKSGIETSDSGLYLYFYVGETVQDANLINAGRMAVLTDSYISHLSMPGSNSINDIFNFTVTTTAQIYTAPGDGVIWIQNNTNNLVFLASRTAEGQASYCSITCGNVAGGTINSWVKIAKGHQCYVQTNSGTATLTVARFTYNKGEIINV